MKQITMSSNNLMVFQKEHFKIKLRGRSGVVYEEGSKRVIIEAEMLKGEIDLVIYVDSIMHWQPPHEKDAISQDERKTIRANVTAALVNNGLTVEWE
ncbi:MAG: Imm74 family immunity protein [bacterium]